MFPVNKPTPCGRGSTGSAKWSAHRAVFFMNWVDRSGCYSESTARFRPATILAAISIAKV